MEFFRKMLMPVLRRDSAFLPVTPEWVCFELAQNLEVRQSTQFFQRFHGTGEIDRYDDTAYVKDYGARRLFDRRAQVRHVQSRSVGAGWGVETVFGDPEDFARHILIAGGISDRKMTTAMT